jgi:hypothetical protein
MKPNSMISEGLSALGAALLTLICLPLLAFDLDEFIPKKLLKRLRS